MPTADAPATYVPGTPPADLPFLTADELHAATAAARLPADEHGQLQLSAHTLRRLLAQVQAQGELLTLHGRQRMSLLAIAESWQTLGADVGLAAEFADYYDAGAEVQGILQNPHHGDPAYADHDPEHDGQGWCKPRAPLRGQ